MTEYTGGYKMKDKTHFNMSNMYFSGELNIKTFSTDFEYIGMLGNILLNKGL